MGKRPNNRVPLRELNLADRFLFDEVMKDSATHRDVLSIIFGKEIPLLSQNETEKELRTSPLIRSTSGAGSTGLQFFEYHVYYSDSDL